MKQRREREEQVVGGIELQQQAGCRSGSERRGVRCTSQQALTRLSTEWRPGRVCAREIVPTADCGSCRRRLFGTLSCSDVRNIWTRPHQFIHKLSKQTEQHSLDWARDTWTRLTYFDAPCSYTGHNAVARIGIECTARAHTHPTEPLRPQSRTT